MSEPVEVIYDVSAKTEVVKVKESDGTVAEYTLKEMNGAQRDAHMNATSGRVRWQDGKAAGIKDFNGMAADLLVRCLVAPNGQPVSVAVIQSWPGPMIQSLYKRAQKLNAIGSKDADDSEEEEKNS